jgi:CubicO group peptidase (beta-lactamase class C family)
MTARFKWHLLGGLCLAMFYSATSPTAAGENPPVFPGEHWSSCSPEKVGLSMEKLNALRDLVGGRGCVVRHGWMAYSWGNQSESADVASAMKPVISTLLIIAVQEGKIQSVDTPVCQQNPPLRDLNQGKDAAITWRHLATQTSGYGLTEPPGQAYAYNDFALALYYDTLMDNVYRQPGTRVLESRLAKPLHFEDPFTFEAFGPGDRPGRLALSVRDFARFGLLWLRSGRWEARQMIDTNWVHQILSSPISTNLPVTRGTEAPMLPHQRSVGGGRNITPIGPGYYSFNWWLNGVDRSGKRLFVDAPVDTYVASGHGGIRMLWIIPSLDLIVSWNETRVEDQDTSPGNPRTLCNQAARLIREAVIP